MVINENAQKAIEKKDEQALIKALEDDYDHDAAVYLAGRLLGTISDPDHPIL